MEWWQSTLQFVNEWQTLIGATLATLAAVATVFVLRRTNTLGQQQAEQRRKRRLMACRAVMPADLSTINQYVVQCVDVASRAIEATQKEEEGAKLAAPVLPDRVMQNLQSLIEWLDQEDADKVADLIGCYQVQNSRLLTEIARFNDPHRFGRIDVFNERNITMMMLERTVELYMKAAKMFEFARRKKGVDHLPPAEFTQDDLQNALFNLSLDNVLGDESVEYLCKELVTE